MESARVKALGGVAVVGILFSTGGAAIKMASMTAWQTAGLRSLIAFAVLWLLAPALRRKPQPVAFLLAVPYAGVMLLFVHANTMASAVSVTLLQASAPVYVLLLAPWLLGERLSSRLLVLLPLFLLGMLILLGAGDPVSVTATSPLLGRGLAAGAGFCFGLIILGLSAVQRAAPKEGSRNSDAAMQAVAYGNLLAAIIAAPFAVALWQPLSVVDVGVAVYLGAVQIGLAYAILLPAMRALKAVEVSLLLLIELVASPVFAALLHAEIPASRTILGGLIVVFACGLESLWGRERS